MGIYVGEHQWCFPDSPKKSTVQCPHPLLDRSWAVEEVLTPPGSSQASLRDQRQNRLTIVFVVYFLKSLLQLYHLKPLETSITH